MNVASVDAQDGDVLERLPRQSAVQNDAFAPIGLDDDRRQGRTSNRAYVCAAISAASKIDDVSRLSPLAFQGSGKPPGRCDTAVACSVG